MSSCAGAASQGSLVSLIALGAADAYLTKDPAITFWRFRYNKYTNFSTEGVEQPFMTQVAFGSDAQLTLNRVGDLVYKMYVLIDLPGITVCTAQQGLCGLGGTAFPCCHPCDPADDGPLIEAGCPASVASSVVVDGEEGDIDPVTCTGLEGDWAHYVNAIGQFLVKRACLIIGGQVVDTLYSDYLFMWEELTGPPGKRLEEMVGRRHTRAQLVADSRSDRRLYVPLPWWFTMTTGNALPLVTLQFHAVQISVCFEELVKCVQVSSCGVNVVKTRDCQALTRNDLSARLETLYVYLDAEERDKFAAGSFEQLVCQTQQFYMTAKSCNVRMQLNFNHPVIELIWAVRRRVNENCNNHFNYSGKWSKDPIKWVGLRLNNQPRFAVKEGRYFRLVQPYQWHTNIPTSYTYCYSFALHPEDAQPSGSTNFSRIDSVELIFDLQDALTDEEVTVMVFARNWNVFRYRDGLGGLAFSN